MAILSNVFGGNDSDNSSSNDSGLGAVVDSATDLGIDYETSSSDTDEDGETTSSENSGSFGTDLNTDSLLGGALSSDSESMSDNDDGGSIL